MHSHDSSIDRELAFWAEDDEDEGIWKSDLSAVDGGSKGQSHTGSSGLGSRTIPTLPGFSNHLIAPVPKSTPAHSPINPHARSRTRSTSPTAESLNLLPFSHTQNRLNQIAQRAWIRSPDSVMLHQPTPAVANGQAHGERVEQGYVGKGKLGPFTTQNVTGLVTTTRKGMGVVGLMEEMIAEDAAEAGVSSDAPSGSKRSISFTGPMNATANKKPRIPSPPSESSTSRGTTHAGPSKTRHAASFDSPATSVSPGSNFAPHAHPSAGPSTTTSPIRPVPHGQFGPARSPTTRSHSSTTNNAQPDPTGTQGKTEKDRNRFLAGASVNKAGVGGAKGRSPEEINKIISEASKGSAFFKREMAKEKALSERCAALMVRTKQIMATADITRLEAEFDAEVAKVEATRDLTQTIVHVDLDAFYAMVEVKRDPTLKGKCFGVGSGVLTTASYEARAYGCRSGMAGFVAKQLCPHLEFVKPNFSLYSEASKSVREVLKNYGIVAMAGMDEGYINITEYMATHQMSASDVVSDLRASVEHATGLTISAGISPCRMLSKIASDYNKPDGQFELEFTPSAVKRFMRDLPIRKIPGIGRVAERYIQALGVETCGDVYKHRATLMAMKESVDYLICAYLGIGSNVVEPATRDQRKSVGCERTFRTLSKDEDILQMLEEIADDLAEDMKTTRYLGRTLTVKYKLSNYNVYTRARSLSRYISTAQEILPIARALLIRELPLTLRLLGIRFSNLLDTDNPPPLNPFLKKSPKKGKAEQGAVVEVSDPDEDGGIDHEGEEEDASLGEAEVPGLRKKPCCPLCSITLPNSWNAINQHVDSCLGIDPEDDDDEIEIIEFKSSRPTVKHTASGKAESKKTSASKANAKKNVVGQPKDAFKLMMKETSASSSELGKSKQGRR